MSKKTLLVDADGVILEYHGWKGPTEMGVPLPQARKALILLSRHFRIVVFSTRLPEVLEPHLRKHGIPFDEVTDKKKPAHLIIDDRAICFQGEWTDDLLKEILNFRPHWETKSP